MFPHHCHTFPHGAFPDQPELGTLPDWLSWTDVTAWLAA
jgi:hypothetical protein